MACWKVIDICYKFRAYDGNNGNAVNNVINDVLLCSRFLRPSSSILKHLQNRDTQISTMRLLTMIIGTINLNPNLVRHLFIYLF